MSLNFQNYLFPTAIVSDLSGWNKDHPCYNKDSVKRNSVVLHSLLLPNINCGISRLLKSLTLMRSVEIARVQRLLYSHTYNSL